MTDPEDFGPPADFDLSLFGAVIMQDDDGEVHVVHGSDSQSANGPDLRSRTRSSLSTIAATATGPKRRDAAMSDVERNRRAMEDFNSGKTPEGSHKIKTGDKTLHAYRESGGVPSYRPPFEILGHHDSCHECSKQFRPTYEQIVDSRTYERQISSAEAEAIATNHTKALFKCLTLLRDTIRKQGNAILKQWTTKTEAQRRQLIKTTIPGLFEKKFPQAHLHYKENGRAWKRAFRSTWLLPYFTIDNICEDPYKLLSLLHHRTNVRPEVWFKFDSRCP
jgi:hypothetical protein